jgi:DNA polymerase III delta prime subunit
MVLHPHMRLFGREAEVERLAKWIQSRRSFLFYGPAGVGKSRLLDELSLMPFLLRVGNCSSANALHRELACTLWKQNHPDFRKRYKSLERVKDESAANLKGLATSALQHGAATLVLEHTGFTSQQFSSAVKQFVAEARLSLVFVARSNHMEDAGYLVRHFPDRSQRLELSNFDLRKAREFAALVADELELEAENRADFLLRVLEVSEGNPGAVLSMVHMACSPKYRAGQWIKCTPLCIDFRLAKNASL